MLEALRANVQTVDDLHDDETQQQAAEQLVRLGQEHATCRGVRGSSSGQ